MTGRATHECTDNCGCEDLCFYCQGEGIIYPDMHGYPSSGLDDEPKRCRACEGTGDAIPYRLPKTQSLHR
jgi:hypothetical protein